MCEVQAIATDDPGHLSVTRFYVVLVCIHAEQIEVLLAVKTLWDLAFEEDCNRWASRFSSRIHQITLDTCYSLAELSSEMSPLIGCRRWNF